MRAGLAALAGLVLMAAPAVAQGDVGPIAVYGNVQTFEIAPVLVAAEDVYPGEAIVSMVRRKLHVLNSAGKADAVMKHWEKLGRPLPDYYTRTRAA